MAIFLHLLLLVNFVIAIGMPLEQDSFNPKLNEFVWFEDIYGTQVTDCCMNAETPEKHNEKENGMKENRISTDNSYRKTLKWLQNDELYAKYLKLTREI